VEYKEWIILSFYNLVNTYRDRLSATGLTMREQYINTVKNSVLDGFDENVSYKAIEYKKINEVVYTTIDTHVFQVKRDTEETSLDEMKRIVFKDLDFISSSGDLLKFEGIDWLVTSTNNIDIIHSCVVVQCGNVLTFQIPDGTVKSYPCIIDGKTAQITDGIEDTKYIVLADDQILIRVQNNVDTSQLEVNKRFINSIYKLTKIQSLFSDGILYLTMTKDQYGVNDNLDLNLADYVVNNFVVTILNGDTVSMNTTSTPLQLNVQVTNNGVLVENPTIVYTSSNPTIASVSVTGLITPLIAGTATITATSNSVSDSITVTVEEVVVDNFSIEYVAPIVSQIYQGQTKTLTIRVLNNGVEVTGKPVTWSISDSSLATITGSTATTCTIKGSSTNLGSINLRATLAEDATVYKEISILIKSII
jgi:uncharacterized protein YjdB